jgi:hypothetical protein
MSTRVDKRFLSWKKTGSGSRIDPTNHNEEKPNMFYIANFQHLTDQQSANENDRRHGNFSMMVQAASTDEALTEFRLRLERFRQSSSLFTGRCIIYLQQIVEFDNVPDGGAVLLNYKSYAGDPLMPFISCALPTEQSNACIIHEWEQGQPITEGRQDILFMEFSE